MRCILLIISFLVLLSCNPTKNLEGKVFKYKSKKRVLKLIFDNDSICRLKNTFYCRNVDLSIRKLTTTCLYRKVDGKIFLENIACNDSCRDNLAIFLPIQQSKSCSFLNKNTRENKGQLIGPNYSKNYRKYGLIPNIDKDTLQIVKNKILLYKNYKRESIGFVFK